MFLKVFLKGVTSQEKQLALCSALYVYVYQYGHRNAPVINDTLSRQAQRPLPISYQPIRASYWRTDGRIYWALAKDLLPKDIINSIQQLCGRKSSARLTTERGVAMLYQYLDRTPTKSANVLGKNQILEIEITLDNCHEIPSMILGRSGEVMLLYKASSEIVFTWRGKIGNKGKVKLCNNGEPESLVNNAGLVATRAEMNLELIQQARALNSYAIDRDVERRFFSSKIASGPLMEHLFESEASDKSAQLLCRAMKKLYNKTVAMLDEQIKPVFQYLVDHEVVPYLQSKDKTLHHWVFAHESLSELVYVFCHPSLCKRDTRRLSLKALVTKNLGLEPTSAELYPYSMSVITQLIVRYVMGRQVKTIAVTNQQYFESQHLLMSCAKHFGVRVDMQQNLQDLETYPDMLFAELHPNNAAVEDQFPQDIVAIVKRITKGRIESGLDRLILALDITMDDYRDPFLQETLRELKGLVDEGALDIHMFQSCAKLLQLGSDITPGGIYIHFGCDPLPSYNASEGLQRIEYYICFLLQETSEEISQYTQIVQENTRYVYNQLQHVLGEKGLVLIPNTDGQMPYISLKIVSSSDVGASKIIEFLTQKLGVCQRMSFGFSLSNLSGVGRIMRLSIGVESESRLLEMVTIIHHFSKLLCVLENQSIKLSDKMLSKLDQSRGRGPLDLGDDVPYTSISSVWDDFAMSSKGFGALFFLPPMDGECATLGFSKNPVLLPKETKKKKRNKSRYKKSSHEEKGHRQEKKYMLQLDLYQQWFVELTYKDFVIPYQVHIDNEMFSYVGPIAEQPSGYLFLPDQYFVEQSGVRIAQNKHQQLMIGAPEQTHQPGSVYVQMASGPSGNRWLCSSQVPVKELEAIFSKCLTNHYQLQIKGEKAFLLLNASPREDFQAALKGLVARGASLQEVAMAYTSSPSRYKGIKASSALMDMSTIWHQFLVNYTWKDQDIESMFEWGIPENLMKGIVSVFAEKYVYQHHKMHRMFAYLIETGAISLWAVYQDVWRGLLKAYRAGHRFSRSRFANIKGWMKYHFNRVSFVHNPYNEEDRFCRELFATVAEAHDDLDMRLLRSNKEWQFTKEIWSSVKRHFYRSKVHWIANACGVHLYGALLPATKQGLVVEVKRFLDQYPEVGFIWATYSGLIHTNDLQVMDFDVSLVIKQGDEIAFGGLCTKMGLRDITQDHGPKADHYLVVDKCNICV
ncbi:hypothetical protein [Candidatus Synchoanobacter obligatus]|uniref:Uncharacterized protein n=1 Tax=Candidatus Synchoanobacter obligatus TaxID=2919597 RepID=A0ABT1L4D7_9GAMM|nr:hypothetical protein [Candidatus Synchoanobacter obligatus]MCP8352042.1 hypothetical protein [Candidatus Synchoanobacter obligatus]